MGELAKSAHGELEPDKLKEIDQFMQKTCGLTLDEIRMRDVGVEEWTDAAGRSVRVSTIYLWARRRIYSPAQAECWETMVFIGDHERHEERYATRDEAVEGHARWITKAKEMVDAL